MGADFDPLALQSEERQNYSYQGPEIIYVFWAKHGPCQVTGCGHRTPIMSNPVMAVKTLSVKVWEDYECPNCGTTFDVEDGDARMAPGVPLIVADEEKAFAFINAKGSVICPFCEHKHQVLTRLQGGKKPKKVELSLLVHPEWLAGSPKAGSDGWEYGGSATDSPEATTAWNQERASKIRLIEVRGTLPEEITCPETGIVIKTGSGTVPQKSHFACGACGVPQNVLTTIKASRKTSPVAAYAIQGYCHTCDHEGKPYGGRFFAPVTDTSTLDSANHEWTIRKDSDLSHYWPEASEVPLGLETSVRTPLQKYQYRYWSDFFNSRQLIVHSLLLQAITTLPGHSDATRELVLSGFQQYLRSNNMFCIWNIQADKLEPFLSKNNLQPPNRPIENCVFHDLGRGNWSSCQQGVIESILWTKSPWELVAQDHLKVISPQLAHELGSAKSAKVEIGDFLTTVPMLSCGSATDLSFLEASSFDLVITDPPFGDILQYAELSDFFYAWLRLGLHAKYLIFSPNHTPSSLEAVENSSRHGSESSDFYKRILTACWSEANRLLKPSGILAFTFHHDKDEPWVAVLESLFEAGFYLEATYPIRADETKGEGSTPGTFGAQKVEYDIIHVCRKRIDEPQPVSWGRMRREVLNAVRQLKEILEHHAKAGLPAADLQVIKRGKALEYFSRHYGKVYVDEGKEFTVRDALIGINQLLDEEGGKSQDPPPVTAEPFTRQFLRLFEGQTDLLRDQMQKYLRGTGISPKEFVERGWCREEKKIYYPVSPLEIARNWHGKLRQNMTSDYDQAMFLIGACFDGSGINVSDTLKNKNFRPHPALGALLDWHAKRAGSQEIRNAAARALHIFQNWERQNQDQVTQLSLFFGE